MSLFQNIYTCFRTTKHWFDVHFDLHCQLDLVFHQLLRFSSSQQYEVRLEERVSVMFFEYVMSNPFFNTRKKNVNVGGANEKYRVQNQHRGGRVSRMKFGMYRDKCVQKVFCLNSVDFASQCTFELPQLCGL